MKPTRETYIPSHPTLFLVEFGSTKFGSCLRAQKVCVCFVFVAYCNSANVTKSFTAGEVITRLEGLSKGPKDYTSVQCGPNPDDHIELNSDLVFGESSLKDSLLDFYLTHICSEPLLRAECGI